MRLPRSSHCHTWIVAPPPVTIGEGGGEGRGREGATRGEEGPRGDVENGESYPVLRSMYTGNAYVLIMQHNVKHTMPLLMGLFVHGEGEWGDRGGCL